MSLEAIIEANTAAVRDLIAAINAQAAGGATESTTAPAPSAKAEKAVKAPAPKPEAPAPAPAEETHEAGDAAEEVTYQQAAKAVTDLSKAKGRAAAEAVLKQFGASKLPEVKPEDFAAVVKACKEAAEA